MAATSVKKVENKTARRGFLKWAKSRKGQQTLIILAFTIIPLVLLAAFTYVPFAEMVKFSFYKMKYSTPVDKRVFVGWKNYIEVFRNKDIFASLWLSLYYMVGSVVQLALALFLATILSFKTRGGNLFKGLMFFPYLISGIAIGFIFKFFYTRGFVLDTVLSWIGLNPESLPYWLKDTRINNASLAATSVWRYMGQNMVLFIGAIMSVDSSLYEAAAIDGANGWAKFRYVILPSIKTIVVLNMILSITGSLSVFEPPYVITGGNFGTGSYFVIMNKLAHENQKVGLASAMAIVLLVLIMIATAIQKWVERYFFGVGDQEAIRTVRKREKRLAMEAKGGTH